MCDLCDPGATALSRRAALFGAGAALAASALPWSRARAEEAARVNAISPDDALQRLIDGNARYAANAPNERDFSADRAARTVSQFPIAAILGCSDSQGAPDLVFDQSPGDLFVVRIAGNFLDDGGVASIEYAVKILHVPLIVVVGHTDCEAIAAAVKVVTERAELPGHLPDLIKELEPAVIAAHARHSPDLVAATIEENVKLNVKNIYDAKPILSEALAAKQIKVAGGVYDIATGKVNMLA